MCSLCEIEKQGRQRGPRNGPGRARRPRSTRNQETWRRRKAEQQRRLVRAYAPGLSAWLQQFGLSALRQLRPEVEAAMRAKKPERVKKSHIIKVMSRSQSDKTLRELMRRMGLIAYDQAGTDAARAFKSQWELKPEIVASYNDELENKIVLLHDDTEKMVRESARRIISDALREDPVPSAKEVGRRLARQWLGPPSRRPEGWEGVWPGRGTAEENRVTADWARSQRDLDEGGKEYLLSFNRAQTIARTEIGQAQNAATAEGISQAGVDEVAWLARPFNPGHDGPGKRNHYQMNDRNDPDIVTVITVAAMNGNDRRKWFKLPSGERAPYPMWIGLSAGNSVNCECGLIPYV